MSAHFSKTPRKYNKHSSASITVLTACVVALVAATAWAGPKRTRVAKALSDSNHKARSADVDTFKITPAPTWKPTHTVMATKVDARIYRQPKAYTTIGYARPGIGIPARKTTGRRCYRGTWYEVVGGGYVCTTRGFDARRGWNKRRHIVSTALAGDTSKTLPFRYAKIKRSLHRAPRLKRVISASEDDQVEAAISNGKRMSSVVSRWMEGAWFVPLVKKHIKDKRVYYEHTNGEFIRAKDIDILTPSSLSGAKLSATFKLPVAFALQDFELMCNKGGVLKTCGSAKQHARFHVHEIIEHDDKQYARGPGGALAPLDKLRIARKIKRPDNIPAKVKWVHFDLAQQVFVAYEGDKPVYTSMISSGAKGHETPTGLYRVERKYVSKTMSGPDPDVGWYEVAEVPWTMFYNKNFAVHGAYWHNKFGNVKSHGCTNVAPIDARWLFYWGSTQLPTGWHAQKRLKGTYFYFTDDGGGEDDE